MNTPSGPLSTGRPERVLYAGRQLQSLLSQDYETLDYASRELKKAARLDDKESTYRNFMFSGLEEKSEQIERKQSVENILINVLTDLKVSNVLIAAGETLGEVNTEGNPQYLDDSLKELEALIQAIANNNNQKETNQALKTFGEKVTETLQILVDEAKESVTSIFDELSKLDPNSILSALTNLGTRLQELPGRGGRLLRKGIHILQEAIKNLNRLVGEVGKKVLTPIKEKVKQIMAKLNEGDWVEEVLNWAFGCESVREQLEQIPPSECLDLKKIDAASLEITALTQTYKEKMRIIQGIVWAIPTGTYLLSLIPTLQLQGLTLFVASAYVLLLTIVILIGMDYTDSEQAIGLVRGVGEVIRSLGD